MQCPKCNKEGMRYKEQKNIKIRKRISANKLKSLHKKGGGTGGKKDKSLRKNFEAKCNKCGNEEIIKNDTTRSK